MQEPQRHVYAQGYQESVGYPANEDIGGQAGWIGSQYEGHQKLQPESEAKLSTTNYVFAILSMVASQLIMFLSIALFVLTAKIFSGTVGVGAISGLPNGVAGMIIAGFVVSLILLLFSIASFVFSVIQASSVQKIRKRARDLSRNPRR